MTKFESKNAQQCNAFIMQMHISGMGVWNSFEISYSYCDLMAELHIISWRSVAPAQESSPVQRPATCAENEKQKNPLYADKIKENKIKENNLRKTIFIFRLYNQQI